MGVLALILAAAGSYFWIDRSPDSPLKNEATAEIRGQAAPERFAPQPASLAAVSADQPGAAPSGRTVATAQTIPIVAATADAPKPSVKITAALRRSLFSKTQGQAITITLPGAAAASGIVKMTRQENGKTVAVQGILTKPQAGTFFFQLQNMPGVAGDMVGAVIFDDGETAYSVVPGANGQPELRETQADKVICQLYAPAVEDLEPVQETPADHPANPSIPSYQNGIVPLSSLPNATGVIYLDFDGAEGPYQTWGGNYVAQPANMSAASIREVWERVSEDYAPFNLNVTTDLQVFLNAPQNSRIRCIITSTKTAAPTAGGVAYVGSFNWTGDTPCWVYMLSAKTCAEAVAHEVGHTLGLYHDGRTVPDEGYYNGHGSGEVGWAPIMGVGYSKYLTQWSKGEYLNADNKEDDLARIDTTNNNVDYRVDDYGATLATAGLLEILNDDSVASEGLIEIRADEDALKFTLTANGTWVSLSVKPAPKGPNLDVRAEIVDAAGTVITSANPDLTLGATIALFLDAGEYFLRVSGVGRGSPTGDGYSDYGSLGFYKVTGSVPNAIKPDRFNLAENSAVGTSVGTATPNNAHGGATLNYSISSGTGSGTFAIDPNTGKLGVANASLLDYETLASNYTVLPRFVLSVAITNPSAPALNETVRVIVTVTDVNEAPAFSSPPSTAYLLKPSTDGNPLFSVTGSDPDAGQVPIYSITAGNSGGEFAIAPATGEVTVANSAALNASSLPSYSLTVRISDGQTPALTNSAVVAVQVYSAPAGYQVGTLKQKFYENIPGVTLSKLTSDPDFPANPDSVTTLTRFSTGENGDNFGSTISGVVFVPVTGDYTFWLASDDQGELRLSTDATAANATVIATVSDWTDFQKWDKSPSQKSSPVTLQAGQAYYIEARYKEGDGGDHCAVAWQGPGFSRQVIGSQNIAPVIIGNPPVASDGSATLAENVAIGTAVTHVVVTDADAGDTYSFAITAGNVGNAFAIDAGGNITTAAALNFEAVASYTLTVTVTDSTGNSDTATITITVTDVDESALTGVTAWEDAVHNATPYTKIRTQTLAGNSTASVDMSAMSGGNATFEFIVAAEDFAQVSATLLRDSKWALNLETWNNTNKLGMVRYGVDDYAASAVAGQSVASPYGRTVHLVYVVDTAAGLTRIYINGVHLGNVARLPVINSATATLGSSDLRNDASPGIHAFAAYNSTLPHLEIITHYRAWFGASSPVDADADSLDDEWELTHYTGLGVVSSSDDSDGDGFSAFEEMVFGMDPKSSSSGDAPQQGTIVTYAGMDKFEVRFRRPQSHAKLNVSYQLQTSDDLTEASWSNENSPPATIISDGNNEWVVYRLPLTGGTVTRSFYRCKVTPR